MLKHACALLASTVISASVCGVVGEIIWPSGPYALVSVSMWLVGVAVIVGPIAYVVVALVRHDARLLRNQPDSEKRSTIRPIAMTTCIVTIAVTFGLGAALRLGWIGR
jgi:hypothetical protein